MNRRDHFASVSLGVVFVALILAFGELDRLVAQVGGGQRFSIMDVTGLAAFTNLDQWVMGWSTAEEAWRVQPFIWIYTGLDAVFIVVYATLASLVINHVFPDAPSRRFPRLLLVTLVVLDVIEDILLNIAGAKVQSPEGVQRELVQAQAWFSVAKWISLLLLILLVLRQPGLLASIGSVLKRALTAVYVQRLSMFLVIVLTVLSILPLHPILEQVPDIQRSWLDTDKAGGAFFAAVVLTVVSIVFWFIGRATAERSHGTRRSKTGLNLLIWAMFPLAVIAGGIVAGAWSASGNTHLFDQETFQAFLLITSFAIVPSVVYLLVDIWRRPSGGTVAPTAIEQVSVGVLSDSRRAGAVLSALIVALPALGFARSVSTQVFLAISAPRPDGDAPPYWLLTVPTEKVVISASVIVLMLVISVAVLWLTTGAHDGADAAMAAPLIGSAGWRIWAALMAALLVAALASMAIWPSLVGQTLGPIAVTVGALGAEVALVGLLSLVLSFRAPLHLFRWVGLKSDPVVAIFLLVPLLIGQFAGTPTLHSIDRLPAPVPWERAKLGEAFTAWLERSDGCVAKVQDAGGAAHSIRPLVLVAAEGGGIRAAVWTVAAMSELVSAGGCASNSVFLSSGVSGGSIGLAIAANPPWDPKDLMKADQPTAEAMAHDLREAVHAVGGSTALATAVQGLLVTDPIASTTGIRLPSYESSWRWRDRASLIEQSWRDAYPPLSSAFDASADAPTGLVVLNSTDIRSGCRVVVSQVELGPGETGLTAPPRDFPITDPTATCSEGVGEPALTIDMLDLFERCSNRATDWATAGLLSARFPVVTPSGTIGTGLNECGRPRLQLVDGGYAENSGLGLLADTAPTIGKIIREYNTLLRAPGDPLVVPYVMYMQNSPKPITEPLGIRDTAEAFVPLVGAGSNATQVAPSSWIQRIMASIGSICDAQAADSGDAGQSDEQGQGCAASAADVVWNADPTRRVVIVQAETQPSISVPLGWGLSDASYCQLVLDADLQAGYSSRRLFEFNNTLGNYLRLFRDDVSISRDPRCWPE